MLVQGCNRLLRTTYTVRTFHYQKSQQPHPVRFARHGISDTQHEVALLASDVEYLLRCTAVFCTVQCTTYNRGRRELLRLLWNYFHRLKSLNIGATNGYAHMKNGRTGSFLDSFPPGRPGLVVDRPQLMHAHGRVRGKYVSKCKESYGTRAVRQLPALIPITKQSPGCFANFSKH